MKLINSDNLEYLKTLPDNSVDSIVTDPPYGISFMGKKWDYDVPSVETWKECLRVLKHGGHILVACGTRTQHRMTVNIEDAGFEIRDIVAWIHGNGFPKSLNIGKAIDKLQGIEYPKNTLISKNGSMSGGNYTKHTREIETEIAKDWEGWGTALKPAMELWTMARKPLSEKNVAENVLKWGTGGINIDGSRVKFDINNKEDLHAIAQWERQKKSGVKVFNQEGNAKLQDFDQNAPSGRFPANVIHDGSDEVTDLFPNTKSGKAVRSKSGGNTFGGNNKKPLMEDLGYKDSGSASRFFYCAKASKSERNDGLDGFEEKFTKTMNDGIVGREHNENEPTAYNKNHHPTVKPVALMRYLVKMITPTGGIVLDPFMGSGSTGIACRKEGFDFIGIELDEQYFKIAEARINNEQH